MAGGTRDDASGRDYFIEAFVPPVTAIVYGAGEVATAFSRIAREIGLRVVIVDARARASDQDPSFSARIREGMVRPPLLTP